MEISDRDPPMKRHRAPSSANPGKLILDPQTPAHFAIVAGVSFSSKKKIITTVLGTAAVSGADATLAFKPKLVLSKVITRRHTTHRHRSHTDQNSRGTGSALVLH